MPKIFGREPALWLGLISAVLSLLVTFQWDALSAEQAGFIVAAVNAIFAAVAAAFTRPVAPSAFTAAIAAIVALLGAYGLDFSQETIGAINLVVLAGLVLITRNQVSPVEPLPAVPEFRERRP